MPRETTKACVKPWNEPMVSRTALKKITGVISGSVMRRNRCQALAVAGEQVAALSAYLPQHGRQPGDVGDRAVHCRTITHGHQQVLGTRGRHLRRHVRDEVGLNQSQGRGELRRFCDHGAGLERPLVHGHDDGAIRPSDDLDREHVVADLLHERGLAGGEPVRQSQPQPRTQRVVPGAEDLGADRGERPQPPGDSLARGRSRNVVSDWLNSRAMAPICRSSRSSASTTSDNGLPSSGRLANTSTKQNDTSTVISRVSSVSG